MKPVCCPFCKTTEVFTVGSPDNDSYRYFTCGTEGTAVTTTLVNSYIFFQSKKCAERTKKQ